MLAARSYRRRHRLLAALLFRGEACWKVIAPLTEFRHMMWLPLNVKCVLVGLYLYRFRSNDLDGAARERRGPRQVPPRRVTGEAAASMAGRAGTATGRAPFTVRCAAHDVATPGPWATSTEVASTEARHRIRPAVPRTRQWRETRPVAADDPR